MNDRQPPRSSNRGSPGVQRRSRHERSARGARGAAYDLLHEVAAEDAYANLVWPRILREANLRDRDAAFATELAYGTLRWRAFLDAVIAECVDRPLDRLDPRVWDLLRLGTYQILMMATAEHAAVAETVNLAKSVAGEGPARLVNAVLRRVVREGDREAWIARVAPGDSLAELSIEWSHPEWMTTALAEALGAQGRRGDLVDVLRADNAPARPVLVARPGLLDPQSLYELEGVQPGRWSPYAAVLERGRPEDIAEVRNGTAGVQDEGSQLVALALASVPVDGPDATWVDLAAGPGGKTALLAGLALERHARLIAVEPHRHRADLVSQAVRAYPPGTVEVVCADGRDELPLTLADRVLLDAPCTGLGALRRRPEARWRRSPADLATLGPLQRELLDAAIGLTRLGGVIAYSTCSPHLIETDLVVDSAVRRHPGLELLDARPYLPGVPDLGPGPTVRLWPHLHGTDGMYLALLRRG